MSYNSERRAFAHLKDNCPQAVSDEYVQAIKTVLERYNTTIYENRFVTGGAVEIFTCALLRSVGLDCTLYAAQEKSGDLLLPGGKQLSVKCTFTGGATDIKLMNQLGSGERPWQTATLFIVSEVGIVYGDPDMADEDNIQQTSDGVVLKRRALVQIISNPANVFSLRLPRKPSSQVTGFSQKASTAVAKQILFDMDLKRLQEAFPATG